MQKTTHVFPIIGGRKIEHLEANLEALNVKLSEEQIQYLESAAPFDIGFPLNFTVSVTFFANACGGRLKYEIAG